MAITTGIPWCKSTFNPWSGCTPVGPGCDHCFARARDHRFFAGAHWGPGAPRSLSSDRYWAEPFKWDRKAAQTGEFWPVFCSSQADIFDNEVPQEWQDRLWALIRHTPHLTWILVTKRIGNAQRMLPGDWGAGYRNVWLVSTVVTQEEAHRDIGKLLAIPAPVRGVSIEPMLGPIDLGPWMRPSRSAATGRLAPHRHLDWVIVGGESRQGAPAREFRLEWAYDLVAQCILGGVPAFVKQMGHNPTFRGERVYFTGKGDNPLEWPARLRRFEFPFGLSMLKAA
ncbi:MAG: DUF5131 family protein [Pseudomonadota bacterium]|jgi:protein gp37